MAKSPGARRRWRAALAGFWRDGCRSWLHRRNLPYFVLLALVAFLVTTRIGGRRESRPLAAPTESAGAARTGSGHILLGQSAAEIAAAWQATVAAQLESIAPEATPDEIVTLAAFTQPCHGQVLLGRGWRRDGSDAAWVYHRGVDLRMADGLPVLAIGPGKVLRIGTDDEGGMQVEIDHGQGWRAVYGRLGKVSVRVGQAVAAASGVGWPIACECHFELWQNRSLVDPLAVFPGLG